ncbi:serine/threonine protein kinase [Sporothrix schenckii ATCC 58251]|uniref:Serine/threonine protein kinase n=1 Tax=Sporothrix schenckii (strain ATCC 58251 / de Perez 2211183) TaxID=1391915 RepID=U7PT29_SPOS1|nr:serine/threonine protein kinase [Sporothrix schenckii ATCC 58251]
MHNEVFTVEKDAPVYYADDGTDQVAESIYEDHGTPAPDWKPPFVLRITTDHLPKDRSVGFMIGRDPDKCDIMVDSHMVSERHIAVRPLPTSGTTLLQNHSKHGTRVNFSRQVEARRLKNTQTVMTFEKATIRFSDDLQIEIERVDDPADWKEYLVQYGAEDTLSMAFLGLDSKIATTNASQRPPVYMQDYEIGQGGFGQVFKAVEKFTGQVYAMKLYKRGAVEWREQGMLQSLKHEYVVQYVAFIDLPGQRAQLIMEYVDGPNLQDICDPDKGHQPLNVTEIQDVLWQLLTAVAYLHGRGVTHRDIKPANIILACRDPVQIKLVDFGLATDATRFNTACGTALYMAPEIVNGHKARTNKVDMFAIGVLILALFGTSFEIPDGRGDNWGPYLDAVVTQRQVLAAQTHDLPAHFDLGMQLLADKPADRPSALECLEHEFFTSTGSVDVDVDLSRSPPPQHRTDPPTQRYRPSPDWAVREYPMEQSPTALSEYLAAPTPRASSALSPWASTSPSVRHERPAKRSRQTPNRSLGSIRTAVAKPSGPSSRSRRGEYRARRRAPSAADGYNGRGETPEDEVDYGDGDDDDQSLYHGSHSRPGTSEYAVLPPGSVSSSATDTASSVASPEPEASRSEPSPDRYSLHSSNASKTTTDASSSHTRLYDDCWLDPMHALGGGSSLYDQLHSRHSSVSEVDEFEAAAGLDTAGFVLTSKGQHSYAPVDDADVLPSVEEIYAAPNRVATVVYHPRSKPRSEAPSTVVAVHRLLEVCGTPEDEVCPEHHPRRDEHHNPRGGKDEQVYDTVVLQNAQVSQPV